MHLRLLLVVVLADRSLRRLGGAPVTKGSTA